MDTKEIVVRRRGKNTPPLHETEKHKKGKHKLAQKVDFLEVHADLAGRGGVEHKIPSGKFPAKTLKLEIVTGSTRSRRVIHEWVKTCEVPSAGSDWKWTRFHKVTDTHQGWHITSKRGSGRRLVRSA